MRITVAGIPRFPGAGSSARGQSAPKTRPKGVIDGQQVNIPAQAVRVQANVWRKTVERVNGYPLSGPEGLDRAGLRFCEFMRLGFPEKTFDTEQPAVPKPTQVGGYKYTQARESNLVKELGNMAP